MRGAIASARGAEDGADAPAAPVGWSLRPHLDGVRAVAVYLVVAFHAGIARAEGGFIGVDVFFVLSGYLVTGLILRGIDSPGRFGLGRFYARRMRRLLPAATVNLLVTALVFRWIATPAELPAATGSMRAASLYVSNWWFIRESTNYFGSKVDASPVAHYWSLSVEEQFYLLWPLLLLGLVWLLARLGRHRRSILAVLVLTFAAVSAVAALSVGSGNPDRAYFGTGTRAYQLLTGAALALAPGIFSRARRLLAGQRIGALLPVAALGALVVAGTSLVDASPITRGILATVATVALLVSLEAFGGPARWLLSLPPVTYLGRISYGTYLWHWIIVLVAVRRLELAPVPTFAASVLLATGIAALSSELIERPVRFSATLDRMVPTVLVCGLATSLLVGLVAVPRLLEVDRTSGGVTPAAATEGTPVTVDWRAASRQEADVHPCTLGPSNVCTLVEGSGPKVLLAGDSHAAMLAPAFAAWARRHDVTLAEALLPYCPWVRDVRYTVFSKTCFEDQQALYEQRIPRFDPDVVVLAHRAVDDANDPIDLHQEGVGLLRTSAQKAAAMRELVPATLDPLLAQGRRVVVVEPIPVAEVGASPLECLSGARFTEECRFVAAASPTAVERALRSVDARRPQVWNLDLDRAVCPYFPICDPVVGGLVVMHDSDHLTTGFAATLDDQVERFFDRNGILPS